MIILIKALWVLISLAYLGLMFMAYPHADEKKKLYAISPYWFFYFSVYDEEGKKLCKIGLGVFFFSMLLLIPTLLLDGM